MGTHTVTVHRTNGAVKRKTLKSEREAYAWVRMAQNRTWNVVYIGPDDQAHETRKVHDRSMSGVWNTAKKQTPALAE